MSDEGNVYSALYNTGAHVLAILIYQERERERGRRRGRIEEFLETKQPFTGTSSKERAERDERR